MDFNRHELGAQRQIDRPQDVDELERFREDIARAIAPLEQGMSPEAEAPSSIRALIERAGHDPLATMPSYQYPTSKQQFFNRNFFVFRAMIIVVGALIGATIAAAYLQRVTLDDLSVTRWVTQLAGASPNAVKNDGTQAILKDRTEEAEPSPLSSQAPAATEAAVVADHPPSSQTTSSSAEPVQPADLAQPGVATSDHSQDSSSRKDGVATPATNEGTIAATGDNESLSPFAKAERNAELYRQYIEWQANREKSQSEQRHSSKRTEDAQASIASKRKPRSKQSD
jgi:hypothetical protein